MRDSYLPYKIADGTNIWDHNDPTLYESGTHTGANASQVLVDSTKSWTVNQWKGWSLLNVTQQGRSGVVSSSTATTITCYPAEFPIVVSFNTGNSYQLRKVIKCLDAPGAGKGGLLVGGSDTVAPTPAGWPNQVDEPIYYWANTGVTNTSTSGYYNIVSGRDFTNAPLAGYVPLVYPHPLAGTNGPPPTPPSSSAGSSTLNSMLRTRIK